MKLLKTQSAPSFSVHDIFGNPVRVPSAEKKKIFLSFMRFAGCAVCNLRVHQLLKTTALFAENNIQVVLVYESSKETMLEYLQHEKFSFYFIADSENKLYDLYSVEKSFTGLLSGLFHGLLSKAMKGQKLFRKSVRKDGDISRMGADFLIAEDGHINKVHYASYLGDHMDLNEMLK